jgi:hypothetical protein
MVKKVQRIGEGKYRVVSAFGFDKVAKTLKPARTKRYGFLPVNYSMWLYTPLKFGIRDINAHEQKNYKMILAQDPKGLRSSFAEILAVRKQRGKSVLVMKKVKDFNGETSKSLKETGPVKSRVFWRRIDKIENFFLEKKIPFFNLNGENILVKKISGSEAIPVIVDYKRIGARTYPFQPHLLIKPIAMQRVKKRFRQIRENYNKAA